MKKKSIVVNLRKEREKIKLDYFLVRQCLLIIRSVNNFFRQKIIMLLDRNKDLCVTDIYIKLGFGQSATSQHLSILRQANVVNAEKEGKFVYYSLNYDRLEQISNFTKEIAT